MCCKYRCENDFCCAISLFTQKGERFRMKLRLLLLSVAKISSPCVTYLVQEYQNKTWGIMERFDIIREMNVSEKKRDICVVLWNVDSNLQLLLFHGYERCEPHSLKFQHQNK